jgi:hypothetical protein
MRNLLGECKLRQDRVKPAFFKWQSCFLLTELSGPLQSNPGFYPAVMATREE